MQDINIANHDLYDVLKILFAGLLKKKSKIKRTVKINLSTQFFETLHKKNILYFTRKKIFFDSFRYVYLAVLTIFRIAVTEDSISMPR